MEPVLTLTYYAQLREQMLTDEPAGSGRASAMGDIAFVGAIYPGSATGCRNEPIRQQLFGSSVRAVKHGFREDEEDIST
jgi:hypothetical protein